MSWLFCLIVLLSYPVTAADQTVSSGNFLDVGGIKLWYQDCGSQNKPSVVLLHDGLVHSIAWDGVWVPLCAKYHVVRYDRRGYGRSDPIKAPFVPVDDLQKIMNQVHMDRAIVVGNSSGGALALDFAIVHPEMVDALFLIGPVIHGMASSDYFNERGAKNSEPLNHNDTRSAAENWSKDRFLIAGEDPQARKLLYDALAQNPQNLKVSGAMEIHPDPPTVARLSEIKVPTLVLVGDSDIADVFAYSGAIEAALPLSSFEVWKDTGHLIQLQYPKKLVDRFDEFVSLADRREVPVTDNQLSAYVGRYKVFNRSAKLSLIDHHLVLKIPDNPSYWFFATSPTKFFLRTEKTEIEFSKTDNGKESEMVVHNSDGSVIRCPREGTSQ